MKVVLIGFMGTGKSTIGPLLAQQLKMPYQDLDHVIEQHTGEQVSTTFREAGEAAFRQLERQLLVTSLATTGVLATGGGAAVQPENADLLSDETVATILLETKSDVLIDRLMQDETRPLVNRLGPAGLMSLKQQRDVQYHKVADFVVDTTTQTPAEVTVQILDWLETH